IRQFEKSADLKRDDPALVKLEKLTRSLASDAPSGSDVALIADLFSIPTPDHDLLTQLKHQRRTDMTFAAILRHFDSLARLSPLLAVFEDVHWADPTTLDLLNTMIEKVECSSILIVITARPEFQPSWAARPQVAVQPLGGLHRRQATSLVKEIVGNEFM